jgi:RNA polymerase sigma-70 factor (sigma-E family)
VVGETDQTAFRELFDRLLPRVQKTALRVLGDPFAAEDVAAETMARTFSRWDKVSVLPHREFWVLRVAANLAVDVARRRAPSPPPRVEADDEDATALRLALVAALRTLPKRQREVVVLRFLTDLSEGDVAVALGISPATVHTHVHRALAALRRTLGADFPEDSHALA